MTTEAYMGGDIGYVAGWVCIVLAIFAFSTVMRDLLLFHTERVAREKELEKLNARDECE